MMMLRIPLYVRIFVNCDDNEDGGGGECDEKRRNMTHDDDDSHACVCPHVAQVGRC